jgi:hypothetical protein
MKHSSKEFFDNTEYVWELMLEPDYRLHSGWRNAIEIDFKH